MKVTVKRESFLKVLTHVQSVVERHNSVLALANVLLVADDNRITLTATDMEMELVGELPVTVHSAGATTVSAQVLYGIVRKLSAKDETFSLEVGKNGDLLVQDAQANFSLHTLPRGDFPAMGSGDIAHEFELPVEDLRLLIQKTRLAICGDTTRHYLTGVYLHAAVEEKQLCGVATDGHRLARVGVSLPKGAEAMEGVIVPRKAVQELFSIMEGHEGGVNIAVSENKVRFVCGNLVLTSKLIDGSFPDYEHVIPKKNDKEFSVKTADFKSTVDRVSTVSLEKSKAIKFGLEKNSLTLSASDPATGYAEDKVEVSYQADALTIGFNGSYLMDIAGEIDEGLMQFSLSDSSTAAIIRNKEKSNVLYVLMPMRV